MKARKIEVSENNRRREQQRGQRPIILYTVGLEPCIGVAIYDHGSRQGFVSHYADVQMNDDLINDINEFINNATGNVVVYLAGGNEPDDDEDMAVYIQNNKKTMIDLLQGRGIVPRLFWKRSSIGVNLLDGEHYIEDDPLEEWAGNEDSW